MARQTARWRRSACASQRNDERPPAASTVCNKPNTTIAMKRSTRRETVAALRRHAFLNVTLDRCTVRETNEWRRGVRPAKLTSAKAMAVAAFLPRHGTCSIHSKTGARRELAGVRPVSVTFARGCHANYDLDHCSVRPDHRRDGFAGDLLRAGPFARHCRAAVFARPAAS